MSREEERVTFGIGSGGRALASAVIVVWGVAGLVAAAFKPGLIENLPAEFSAVVLVFGGLGLLASTVRDSRVLYAALALGEVVLMVGSGIGVIQWSVSYDASMAAVAMAVMHFIVAIALIYNLFGGGILELAPVPGE